MHENAIQFFFCSNSNNLNQSQHWRLKLLLLWPQYQPHQARPFRQFQRQQMVGLVFSILNHDH